MAFDQNTRNRLQRFVADARSLLSDEFTRQLQATYGMNPKTGEVADIRSLSGLTPSQQETAHLLRDTLAHYLANAEKGKEKARKAAAIERIVREQAFTVLNRLAALRMSEARGFLIESLAKGYDSKGFQWFHRISGTSLGETGDAYRHYLFSLFDEFSLDLSILFDRFSVQGRLFPSTSVLLKLLALINDEGIAALWAEDETIGWIYQYFNSIEERKKMRAESQAPRNSRELAVRNQFFTPRYVVEFLTDNTLGRIWYEMTHGATKLKQDCKYLVRRPNEFFLVQGEIAPEQEENLDLSQEELLQQTVYIENRALKDPRDIRMLDPACGSMHFGLYAFDLFEAIYNEAWDIEASQGTEVFNREQGRTPITREYSDKAEFLIDVPRLIIENNIHGVDIDPRAVQIAGLSLWLRAHNSWQQSGVKPQNRPKIQRSNIVCAEPMPGEKALLEEFTASLKPTVLGQLVEIIFEKMELAGEAGTLLKIEQEIQDAIVAAKQVWKQQNQALSHFPDLAKVARQRGEIPFDVSDIDDEEFWEQAEQKILDALADYAQSATNDESGQKRLFAEDASKGFAFIELCRKRFDVVLMNPPFGATSSKTEAISFHDKASCKNLFGAFVMRGEGLIHSEKGKIGVISDRSFVLKESYEDYRIWLYKDKSMELFADLGWDVLDANVEVCCYTIGTDSVKTGFVRLTEEPISCHPNLLENLISNLRHGQPSFKYFGFDNFKYLPHLSFSYWLPDVLLADFSLGDSLEIIGGKPARGMSSGNVNFACRLIWEVPIEKLGPYNSWNPVNVGGGKIPFFRSPFMAFYYKENWGAMRFFPGFSLKNTHLFWKLGIGWGKRTDLLSTQLIPRGMITAEDGQIFVPHKEEDIWLLLGFLNSQYAQTAINSICGGHKGPGYLAKIPLNKNIKNVFKISDLAKEGVLTQLNISSCDETSLYFVSPFIFGSDAESAYLEYARKLEKVNNILRKLDEAVFYGLGKKACEIEQIKLVSPGELVLEGNWAASSADFIRAFISYGLGIVYGRWDVTHVKDTTEFLDESFELSKLPEHAPGMLRTWNNDTTIIDSDYPVNIIWSGILVNEKGNPNDLVTNVHEALKNVLKDELESIELQVCRLFNVTTLRDYFNKPLCFFSNHLDIYSKSRRKAPIYWPLQTLSCSYTLWLYYHRLNEQTLFTCVNDFVEPKLQSIKEDFITLKNKPSRSKDEEKEFDRLTDFKTELEDFRDELLRIAKFWKPNLNDGVQITAAPLWRLFQHKVWQNKLKETWEQLEEGEYDWAHLAYSIWPVRVLRKCHQDRSLAIAHGVEDELWHEVEVIKGRKKEPVWVWQPKPLSDAELNSYIQNKLQASGTVE